MLVQIGDMTVSFGHLEFWMRYIFTYLVNQSAIVGEILASYLSFSNLRAGIISLYEERFASDELFGELKKPLKEAAAIEQERNAITHSSWLAGKTPTTSTRHKVTAREKSGFKKQTEQYSEHDLFEFNQRIKELTNEFIDFYAKLPQKLPLRPN